MDILSHTFSGMAVGTVAMNFSNGTWQHKSLILLISTLGGFLPDIDVITMWSGFDGTIGKLFNLPLKGREYYHLKLWFSHHSMMHSIFVPIALSLLTIVFYKLKTKQDYNWRVISPIVLGFSFGFLAHLLEDMPTPHFVWGGVRLFFPSEVYIGGTGDIWWWNNYDLFLLIIVCIVLNLSINFFTIRIKKVVSILIFTLTTSLFLYQINTRPFNFQYKGSHSGLWQKYENESKKIQKEILGEKIFNIMEAFDNKLSIYF